MAFALSAYTETCAPTWTDQAPDLDAAKELALGQLGRLKDRAFGAVDHSQVDGTEAEYEAVGSQISSLEHFSDGTSLDFGPLPDGYIITIETS